ncbi:hypothetical protein PS002_23685, partial [Shigella sonnei]|nr:hypothetical protein [Shigella sonnei]
KTTMLFVFSIAAYNILPSRLIADIHDMAISRDGNMLYAAIENTNSIVVFDLGQKQQCCSCFQLRHTTYYHPD